MERLSSEESASASAVSVDVGVSTVISVGVESFCAVFAQGVSLVADSVALDSFAPVSAQEASFSPSISAQMVLENFSFSFGKIKQILHIKKRGRLPSFLVHTALFFLTHHLQFLDDEVLCPDGRISLARLPILDSSQGNQKKLGHAFLRQARRLPGFFYARAHTPLLPSVTCE